MWIFVLVIPNRVNYLYTLVFVSIINVNMLKCT